MRIQIDEEFDCTERQFVVAIAQHIYRTHGHEISNKPWPYLFNSKHPTEQAVLYAAEAIYELFTGDSPSYDDEDED